MVGSRSIAAGAAIALMTSSSLSASSPHRGCEGPDAPVKAVVDSAKHAVVITLGPCLVPNRRRVKTIVRKKPRLLGERHPIQIDRAEPMTFGGFANLFVEEENARLHIGL